MTTETNNVLNNTEYEYELWQHGVWQAGGRENDYASAQSEANHYAMLYAKDGPVEVRIYEKRLLSITQQSTPTRAPEPEVHSYDPTDRRESVTIRWPDGKCLSYVLDRTRYTDNLPPERAQQQEGERDWLAEAMDALAEWRFDALKQED